MKSTWTLPEGYGQKYLIDLKDNKKQFWIVNGLSIAIMLALVALFFQLLWYGFLELHFEGLPIQALVMAVGMLAYIPLHELVHGVCIRRFSGKRAKYGFTLVYAYAGSDCYFNKRDYLIIAAAPVVFWVSSSCSCCSCCLCIGGGCPTCGRSSTCPARRGTSTCSTASTGSRTPSFARTRA